MPEDHNDIGKTNKIPTQTWIIFGVSIVVLIALLVVFANGFGISSNKPKVAATIFPLYDLVRNVAGEHVETVLVLPPGANPHTFEPRPSDVRAATGSDMLFFIGYGLDNWAQTIASSAEIPEVVQADAYVMVLSDEYSHDEEGDDEMIDPHYWLSVPNAIGMIRQIAEELSFLYPEYADEFAANAQEYTARLETLDAEIHTQLAPFDALSIATFHNSWAYFAHEYGMEVVATFEEFSGKEPTAGYLANFQETIREYGIQVVFTEPQSSSAPLQPIADDLGVTLAELDDIGGAAGRESYIDLMRYNVNQIRAAL